MENFLPYSRPFLEDYMTSLYNGILEGELKEAQKINPIFVAQGNIHKWCAILGGEGGLQWPQKIGH